MEENYAETEQSSNNNKTNLRIGAIDLSAIINPWQGKPTSVTMDEDYAQAKRSNNDEKKTSD